MEVQDDIQLCHRGEEVVEDFHEEVDGLQRCKLVVPHIKTHNEVKMCISSEN